LADKEEEGSTPVLTPRPIGNDDDEGSTPVLTPRPVFNEEDGKEDSTPAATPRPMAAAAGEADWAAATATTAAVSASSAVAGAEQGGGEAATLAGKEDDEDGASEAAHPGPEGLGAGEAGAGAAAFSLSMTAAAAAAAEAAAPAGGNTPPPWPTPPPRTAAELRGVARDILGADQLVSAFQQQAADMEVSCSPSFQAALSTVRGREAAFPTSPLREEFLLSKGLPPRPLGLARLSDECGTPLMEKHSPDPSPFPQAPAPDPQPPAHAPAAACWPGPVRLGGDSNSAVDAPVDANGGAVSSSARRSGAGSSSSASASVTAGRPVTQEPGSHSREEGDDDGVTSSSIAFSSLPSSSFASSSHPSSSHHSSSLASSSLPSTSLASSRMSSIGAGGVGATAEAGDQFIRRSRSLPVGTGFNLNLSGVPALSPEKKPPLSPGGWRGMQGGSAEGWGLEAWVLGSVASLHGLHCAAAVWGESGLAARGHEWPASLACATWRWAGAACEMQPQCIVTLTSNGTAP
jgi:hypothetical protein